MSFWKNWFVYITKIISISGKITLFSDHLEKDIFGPYIWIYKHFQKNNIVLRSLLKIVFCPYIRKYHNFEKNIFFYRIFFKSRSSANERFFRSLRKNSFLSICLKISSFREKIRLKESFSLSIYRKISTIRKKVVVLGSLLKIVFCTYLRKNQYSRIIYFF